MNVLGRAMGLRFTEPRYARFRWGEVSARGWGIGISMSCYDDHWSLGIRPIFGSIYFRLWSKPGATLGDDVSYGFSWYWGRDWGNDDSIHLNWGKKTKIIHMPWGWLWQRTSYLLEDGRTWAHELAGFSRGGFNSTPVELKSGKDWLFLPRDLPRWQVKLPYVYVLRNGTRQERIATVGISEMEWRMRALTWLPWPKKTMRTIDIEFDDEVGERSGSWKGGCVGCSYELKKGETAAECLKRMEAERTF